MSLYIGKTPVVAASAIGGDPLDLPPELAKIAYDDFGETPEVRRQALTDLRKRIAELPDQKDRLEDVSDANLIRFVRGRKYNLDKALETTIALQNFCNDHPDWLTPTGEELLLGGAADDFCTMLPKPDKKNRRVYVMFAARGLKYFTKEFVEANPDAMIKLSIWMLNQISRDPYVQVAGLIVVNTFQNFTMSDNLSMSRMAPISHHLASFSFFNKCACIRLAGTFFVEAPVLYRAIFELAKVFLSAKIRDRIFFLGTDCAPLHSMVEDVSVLPTSLGGGTADDAITGWVTQQVALTTAEAQQKKG
jgi:hypothetical protein